MIFASATKIAHITASVPYASGVRHDAASAAVNREVARISGNRVPCYAIAGKRVAFKWVSVGSSAVISRTVAADMLRRVGVDIETVELFDEE